MVGITYCGKIRGVIEANRGSGRCEGRGDVEEGAAHGMGSE